VNGGKHPSTSLLYLSWDNGGRGLCSIEREYKETEVKAAVKLFQNRDPMMKLMCDFEKRAESVRHQSLTKKAAKYAGEYGLQLKLQYPDPVTLCHRRRRGYTQREAWKSPDKRARIGTERGRRGPKMARQVGNSKRRRWVAKHWAMLLLANQVVIMPITYRCGYVQIKATAFTHLIVRHPQDTHESEQWPNMKDMR